MRILLLDQYSDRGGGQGMLLQTLCAVRRRGWNALVGLPGGGPLFEQVHGLGFRTARIECGRRSTPGFVAEMPKLARQIGELAARFQPRLLYLNGPRLLPAAALARVQTPALFHAHIRIGSIPQRWLAGAAARELNASVVAVSESVAAAWRPFGKVSVVHNAVAGPGRPRAARSDGPPRIGCIGRISPEKGQREFLEVARRILRTIPDARFFVFGAALFGDAAAERYEEEVRAEAADLPVEFPGWVDDVYDALNHLDLLLVPSVWPEPAGLVILEAFAAGVPVIAFRVGGIPEFLDQLAGNVEEMATMALQILSDPVRHRVLAEQGREIWRTRFHPRRYYREITEIILRAASENR